MREDGTALERELAFLERELATVADDPELLHGPAAYAERAHAALAAAGVAPDAASRASRYSDAAVAAALGALVVALRARQRTSAATEIRFLIYSLRRAQPREPAEAFARLREAADASVLVREEAFVVAAAAAAAAATSR
jgi:hypothetical protein